MTDTCTTCRWHRVRFFAQPHSPDGVKGTYSDRCMRYAKNPDDMEAIGWNCVAETAPGDSDRPNRCGPGRKYWEAKA